jgi:hypothetical protein
MPVSSTEPYAALGTARVWSMLLLRSAYALGLQLVCAAGFWLAGSAQPWQQAADWWLVTFTVGHLLNLELLQRTLEWEGWRFRDLFPDPIDGRRKRDAVYALVTMPIAIALAWLPGFALGRLLLAESSLPAALVVEGLSVPVLYVLLLAFPILHALTELPTYFGYALPRLRTRHGWQLRAVLVCALFLALQQLFLPLLFDWRLALWRVLSTLPFALWLGLVLDRRPSVLPFLVVGHALLAVSLPLLALLA